MDYFICLFRVTGKFINWQKEEIYEKRWGGEKKSRNLSRFFFFFTSGHQLLFLFEIKMFIFVKISWEHYIKFTRMKL